MPLDATDPRPRNPFGQFAGGTSVTPDQMNRAYGIRTRVLASLLRTRPAMQNIPPLSSKDIARVTGLAAKARSVVEFARGDQTIAHAARNGWFPGAKDAALTFPAGRGMAKAAAGLVRDDAWRMRQIIDTASNRGGAAGSPWSRSDIAKAILGNRVTKRTGHHTVFSSCPARVLELARGDYAIPAMYKAKMIPYQSFHPSEYRNPMHANLVETALKRTGPKGIQLRRDRLAKVLRAQRAAPALAGLALSALAARAVELAELPGEKIRRPQFVEEDGVVKIVKTDGTAAEIGRAPGFANRLRRNKGKLIAGGLATAAGAVLAKKLLGKGKPAA